LQRANWTAQSHIQKTQTYSQYVDNIDIDENEASQAGFKIVTNPRAIEDAMIHNEDMVVLSAIIKSLPVENQQIVAMLSLGMNQRSIAAELKVTEQKVSETMKSIRTTLKLSFA
jgi:DNA-directed RNA polymerase specialized sigma subunit